MKKHVNLALQGGGAHGAFTWGVLDRLLEDGRIIPDAISGTSAGAMNAVTFADGFMREGYDGARAQMRRFWKAIGTVSGYHPLQPSPVDVFLGKWGLGTSPGLFLLEIFNRMTSPYLLNPLNLNPLAEILESIVDFELVRSCDQIKIYVSATNVETGRVRVFDRHNLRCEMVMASACLPFLFQAVEIDGVPYWDGGYMGNPALFPFYDPEICDDILIVQVNPMKRKGTPKTARAIFDRVTEITFNASLMRELRSIELANRQLAEGKLNPSLYRTKHVHIIEPPKEVTELGAASRFNAQWDFLQHLHEIGRRSAEQWLDGHFDALGKRSTVDLRTMFDEIGGGFSSSVRTPGA